MSGLFANGVEVTSLRHPGLPPQFRHLQARMPARAGVDATAVAVVLCPTEEPPPRDPVIASCIRHWCGEDLGQLPVTETTATQLARSTPVLRLSDLQLHDPALHEESGCPLVPVGDDTTLPWVPARRWPASATEHGWVPYSQAFVRYLDGRPDHPVAHAMNFTGLAAARTLTDAVEQACAEIIAQDAVIAWWVRGGAVRLPQPDPDPVVALAGRDSSLTIHSLALPSTTGVAVSLVVIDDPVRDVINLAAGTDPTQAAAVALWQHVCALDLLDADGDLVRAGIPGTLPYSPARDYLLAAGPGARRAGDPMAAVQLGLDPRLVETVRRRTRPAGVATAVPVTAVGAADALLAAGHDVWVVDLTTPDVAEAGWSCVRVLATGMARIPLPALRLDVNGRVGQVAMELGWPEAPEEYPYPGW